VTDHYQAAEQQLAEAPQESDGTWALARAQMAAAHATLALIEEIRDARTPCPCEADEWPMDPPPRPVTDIIRPDLFGEAP
jgi:hypothetical protein